MNKIPKNVKYILYGTSALIFLLLNSVLGLNLIVDSINQIYKITEYHFAISTHTIDYLIFAIFPIFGMLRNSKRKNFIIIELVTDILTILFWIIFTSVIGCCMLVILADQKNPLIPEYIIQEPFDSYSTLIIIIGIILPFLIKNQISNKSENKN
jgi:hypothetical protein